jgi:hypothetical protein
MQVAHRCFTSRTAPVRPARNRQSVVRVHAYALDAGELRKAAFCVPTPFVSTPAKHEACPAQLLQRADAQYHGSQWMNDLVLSSSDGDDTVRGLRGVGARAAKLFFCTGGARVAAVAVGASCRMLMQRQAVL